MRDLALRLAGVLAIAVALAHGVIAERKVFGKARIEPGSMRELLRLVWHASTLDWMVMGSLLIAAPALGSDPARHWLVAAAVVVYAYAALANALASRGRHPGWCLMVGVIVLALLGR